MNYPELTLEQLNALRSFANRMPGGDWKTLILTAWSRGYTHDEHAVLYPLRNSHGPSWLEGFTFPEDEGREIVEIPVRFQKQGGNISDGIAIGRQGMSKFLIKYRINDGSPRERWIPKNRIEIDDIESFKVLEVWRNKICPSIKLDQPIVLDTEVLGIRNLNPYSDEASNGLYSKVCEKCGNMHGITVSKLVTRPAPEGAAGANRYAAMDGGSEWRFSRREIIGTSSKKLGIERVK